MNNAFLPQNSRLLARDASGDASATQSRPQPSGVSAVTMPGFSSFAASRFTQQRFSGTTTEVEIAPAVNNGTRTLLAVSNDGVNPLYINLDLPTGAAAGRTGLCVPASGSLVLQLPFSFNGRITAVADGAWSCTVLEGTELF